MVATQPAQAAPRAVREDRGLRWVDRHGDGDPCALPRAGGERQCTAQTVDPLPHPRKAHMLAAAGSRGSKPGPSSETLSSTWSRPKRSVTQAWRALACLRTLVKLSWAMRRVQFSFRRKNGGVIQLADWKSVSMPVRFSNSSVYSASTVASPPALSAASSARR